MRVSDISRVKGDEVASLSTNASVQDLLDVFADRNIGAVVLRENARVVGMVSERDLVRAARHDLDRSAPVRGLGNPQVITCIPDDDVEDLARVMTDKRVRHVLVVDDEAEGEDDLVGIVSIGDVVKARLDELQFERDSLRDYVIG